MGRKRTLRSRFRDEHYPAVEAAWRLGGGAAALRMAEELLRPGEKVHCPCVRNPAMVTLGEGPRAITYRLNLVHWCLACRGRGNIRALGIIPLEIAHVISV